MLSIVWFLLIFFSLIFGIINGTTAEVTNSISIGAKEAVTLCISIAGMICFWSGIMEILMKSGLSEKIAKLFSPILKLLFKDTAYDKKAMNYISANFTANLLGLSNAATPMGLKAANRIYELNNKKGVPRDLIMLVIINCSSIQLIPTTVAGIRQMYGSSSPFDILPAVLVTSLISVLSGVFAALILRNLRCYK